ncbi:MAG: hypothetical protein ACREAB_09730 [Blastocatellia bacterium]
MKNDVQENLIYRYLLRDLPESEQVALEERYFADSETFEQIWETENRLVDEYVRGGLASADRALFEERYLASPVHRRRVAAARKLLVAADESAHDYIAPEIRTSFLKRLTDWLQPSPSWQFAMAAGMLLLMAGGLWLLVERTRLRGELLNLQTENVARQNRERELARQIAVEQSERNQLSAELEQLRKQQTEARPVQNPAPPSALTIFSFALSPIGVRGGDGQLLELSPNADQAQLQLKIQSGDWQNLQVSIKTAEGQPVWSQRRIKPHADKVIVNVPANKLPFNDYTLTLTGANRAGETQVINRYSFRVIRN